MSDLILVGDEAYTPEEWARRERRRELDRERYKRPERRAQMKAAMKRWRERHPAYKRAARNHSMSDQDLAAAIGRTARRLTDLVNEQSRRKGSGKRAA